MVERFKAIQAFIPETFYKIKGTYTPASLQVLKFARLLLLLIRFVPVFLFFFLPVLHEVDEDTVEFSWKRNRLFNHTACLVLYQICMEVGARLIGLNVATSQVC